MTTTRLAFTSSSWRVYAVAVLWIQVWLNLHGSIHGELLKSTIVLSRGIGPSSITEDFEIAAPEWCEMEPNRTIIISHPQSIDLKSKHHITGKLSLDAVAMVVDHINNRRCGVNIQGLNYSITLKTYGDNSDPGKHESIGRYIVNQTDFLISGYSSTLTQYLAPLAQSNRRVLVSGGSSRTAVFQDRQFAFGIFPPADTYFDEAMKAVASLGAKTIATLTEEGLNFMCDPVSKLAALNGVEFLKAETVPASAHLLDLRAVANDMSRINPDVMVTCTYDLCAMWLEAMRQSRWSPKAQIFSICLGLPELEVPAGDDIRYIMGIASWSRIFESSPDAVTGWTPEEFARNFEKFAFLNATYHHAAAATSISVLVQAIERANSIDSQLVQQEIAGGQFDTMYGAVSFDENGQNQAQVKLLQYSGEGELRVVYPPIAGGMEIKYPMPTWDSRDCEAFSPCVETNGTCLGDGQCGCKGLADTVSLGNGATAFCKKVPREDMSYYPDTLVYAATALVAGQTFTSFFFIGWTYFFSKKRIVKSAGPFYLNMVAIGCFILAFSILPTTFQGAYRYTRNPLTGNPTDIPNDSIVQIDAACMAFPWTAGLGFAVMFSALFAKIWRARNQLIENSDSIPEQVQELQRETVSACDISSILVVMIVVECSILLSWQFSDPLRWERKIITSDEDGFPELSAGMCTSEYSRAFALALCVINGCCLLYALWLCNLTRCIQDDYNEGKWLTITVAVLFQIILLAIPVMIVSIEAGHSTTAFSLQTLTIFLASATTSGFIFVPKMGMVNDELVMDFDHSQSQSQSQSHSHSRVSRSSRRMDTSHHSHSRRSHSRHSQSRHSQSRGRSRDDVSHSRRSRHSSSSHH